MIVPTDRSNESPPGSGDAVDLYLMMPNPRAQPAMRMSQIRKNSSIVTLVALIAYAASIDFASVTFLAASPMSLNRTRVSLPIAKTYFVSPAGDDSNDGTSQSTAWQTIAKVNAGYYDPGDSIRFQGGQTFSGALSFSASSWSGATAAEPVTIGSYGTGKATINSGSSTGIEVHNNAGIVVENLSFVGATGNNTNGAYLLNDLDGNIKLNYAVLTHLNVSGYGKNGVMVDGENGTSGFNNVMISYVTSHGNTAVNTQGGTAGIEVYSGPNFGLGSTNAAHTNITIDHCNAYSNPGNPTTGVNGWSGAGIFMANTNGGTIQYSVAANNATNTGGSVGIFVADATNITIQFNDSYGTWTTNNWDGDGFDVEGGTTNAVMQYNHSHDNLGAGYFIDSYYASGHVRRTSNIVLRYNVSQNDAANPSNPWGYGGISIGNSTGGPSSLSNINVYKNKVYASKGALAPALTVHNYTSGPIQNLIIANNLFYATNGSPFVVSSNNSTGTTAAAFFGNNYYTNGRFSITWGGTTYSSLAAWQAAGRRSERHWRARMAN